MYFPTWAATEGLLTPDGEVLMGVVMELVLGGLLTVWKSAIMLLFVLDGVGWARRLGVVIPTVMLVLGNDGARMGESKVGTGREALSPPVTLRTGLKDGSPTFPAPGYVLVAVATAGELLFLKSGVSVFLGAIVNTPVCNGNLGSGNEGTPGLKAG
ncbi:hypothetical protein BP6252_06970 [Coleophoma cylindrospora]|uniref:Uncharacterized protein n=1 Tax=Coleophoma cylindrospora TaxID=1849047 RepID=A0A3D8RG72_9HELO|nr:hypothetical protein BP6252_06970 [Coleophoma cylindrospora]